MTTQFASASYQEIVDLHTESDTVSVIGIHTPQGDTPRKMFGGFFDQFKKFKYLGCSIKLVPAARLPADPLQVSTRFDQDFQTIDPRDMLNPLMFHGCHGNDMGVILNRLYSLNSVDGRKSDSIVMEQDTTEWTLEGILAGDIPNFQLEDLYYKALTDNTWKKAHPQRGFRKSGLRPLVYKMSTNMQMLGSGQSLIGVDGLGIPGRMIENDGDYSLPVVQSGRQFFTPGLTGLGWLDTRNVLTSPIDVDYDGSDYDNLDEAIPAIEKAIRTATLAQQDASESTLPLVYMGMILLPPAYKTEQYFRMIINHHFAFKDFRGISFSNNLAVTPAYDNFNADASDDPDDPDPPSPPEPDPPIAGGVVLLDSLYSGGITLPDGSGNYSAAYATMNDIDGNDYTVAQSVFTQGTMTTGFFCKQNMTDGMIGYILRFASSTTVYYYDGTGTTSRSDVVDIVYYNGAFALHTDSNNWITNARNIQPVNVGPVLEFSMTPVGAPSAANVGTSYVFEGVSYGS